MRVLLLGNGLLQSFGGESWDEFLKSICKRKDLPELKGINCPEPLKAILLTNDKVDVAMKEKCAKILNGEQIKPELALLLKEILALGFDHILTTNYTYELEQAAVYPERLSENRLKKMATSTQGQVEKKYLIHTYNSVRCDGVDSRIWHVHGEARKPSTTILGHYYYGNSLYKIKDEADKIGRVNIEEGYEATSWVEAFLRGDIYCLGFGYGFAEFDLWWLLNRKALERNNAGKLYFYEPYSESEWAKYNLLQLMKTRDGEPLVNICNLGCIKNDKTDWRAFYRDVIADVEARLNRESPHKTD